MILTGVIATPLQYRPRSIEGLSLTRISHKVIHESSRILREDSKKGSLLRYSESELHLTDSSQDGFLYMQYDTDTQLAQASSEVSQKLACALSTLLAPLLVT